MIIVNEEYINTNGTNKQGEVTNTYWNIVDCFGEPTYVYTSFRDVNWASTKVAWSLEIDDVVVTIYDWFVKSVPEHNMLWMIGGREPKAVDKYKEAMREHGKRKLNTVKQHFGRDNDKLLVS
jgi:hypothetical protein